MRILCLDLSLHCGYAILDKEDDKEPVLSKYGTLHYDGIPRSENGDYPWSYINVVSAHIKNVYQLILDTKPYVLVIEETNKGKNRYSQKMLEFLHHELLTRINDDNAFELTNLKIVYLDTSHWRSVLGIWLTKDQKKNNAKLSKAKREGANALKAMKKKLGVRGKTNKKHAAIAHANATFNLQLKVKDNDAADAICLGLAYLKGAIPSNGE